MWDEILDGDPLEKWAQILVHANPTSVRRELERILGLIAIYEIICEENDIDPEKRIKQLSRVIDEDMIEKLTNKKQSLAIESMAKVLGQEG
ncbi:MAG: DUF2018 family protein [Helicobacter sp.]|nr:DUF2018 family protein [Helicobacter sp.]